MGFDETHFDEKHGTGPGRCSSRHVCCACCLLASLHQQCTCARPPQVSAKHNKFKKAIRSVCRGSPFEASPGWRLDAEQNCQLPHLQRVPRQACTLHDCADSSPDPHACVLPSLFLLPWLPPTHTTRPVNQPSEPKASPGLDGSHWVLDRTSLPHCPWGLHPPTQGTCPLQETFHNESAGKDMTVAEYFQTQYNIRHGAAI